MSTLRIAQVMASGPVAGGLEKHFVDLCSGLSDRHQVLALAHPDHGKRLAAAVHFEPTYLTSSRRSPLNLLRLHRALKRFQPDVIHAHANKAAAMISALSPFFSAKKIATVHSFKRNNRVFSGFDTVIAVSSAIEQHVNLPQCCVIANGIPPRPAPSPDKSYFQREFGLDDQKPIAVSLGRLAAVKGYDGLLRAWQGIDAHLVIAGEGPEREHLLSLRHELQLHDRVHLVGYRTDADTLLAHADLMVISSEREGFPYSMVEALHLEKPIVSTAFPGASDLLPADYLAPYGDIDALRRLLVRTLVNLEHARRDYQPIWQRALQQFTVEHMVQRTEQIYLQACCRGAA